MKKIALSECCQFLSGGTPSKSKAEFWVGTIPWYSPKDMKSFDLNDSQDHISEAAIDASATRKVLPGTILVVGRSGVLAHTLAVGIVHEPAAFNQDIKALIPKQGFDSDYVALFLRAQESYVLASGVKLGSTVHSLKSGFIEALEMPCLTVERQRHVAAVLKTQLAAVDEARQAAQAQLSEIRQLKTLVLNEVFASIDGTCPLGNVARIQSGYAFKSADFQKQGVRLLRNANIVPGKVYWTDSVFIASADAGAYPAYSVSEGDVLISLDRPIISTGIKVARVMRADLPALLVQRVGRFQIDKTRLDADYLYAFLQTQAFIDTISGHEQSLGVPHISPGQIEAVDIPLPDLKTQKRLAIVLSEIVQLADEAQVAAKAQLQDIELLPSRLLAQVFDTQGEPQND